ncbi:MAG: hypothetical protein DMG97_41525 [Acidobacteria bacterium]|nr:MAG: hypothetical protein DMG97_41525 [Acidobacteriota bacterium]
MSLSADSRSAATVQVRTTRSLNLLTGEGSSQAVEPAPLAQAADPRLVDWTVDGKLLISDGEKITRMDADGQNATVLVDDPNASVLSFSVCGDHYLLLSWAYHAGNRLNIWRTNADGSAPKQLTSGDFERSPICSPDGKWVYFIDRPGTSRLMRVSVDGGASEPLPASNVPNQFGIEGISFIARDGKSVGFVVDVVDTHTNDAQTKLAIVKLEAGSNAPPRLLDLDARLGSPKNFGVAFGNGGVQPLPNLTGVAYPITENGVNNVWLQPLDGSPGHQLTHFTGNLRFSLGP